MQVMKDFEEFKRIVEEYNGVIIVAIGPENCAICERYEPAFKELLEQYKDYEFKAIRLIPDEECITELKLCGPSLAVYKNHHLLALIPVEHFKDEFEFKEKMKDYMKKLFS